MLYYVKGITSYVMTSYVVYETNTLSGLVSPMPDLSHEPRLLERGGSAKLRYAIWLGIPMFLRQVYVFQSGNEA